MPVTPGISLLPTFTLQFHMMKRTFLWVIVLGDLVRLEALNFSFFSNTGWGIDLDYWILNGLPWTGTEIILLSRF